MKLENEKDKIDKFFERHTKEELEKLWKKYDKYSSREDEDNLVEIRALVGSLIVSPEVSKEDNIKMFEQWLKEVYKN